MSKSFFETDSFAQLNKEWNEKLKESGFDDIVDIEDNYVLWPQVLTPPKGGEDAYEFNQRILRDFPFRRDVDRAIFELHSAGKTEREIEAWLKCHDFKPLTQQRINQIINKIKHDFARS